MPKITTLFADVSPSFNTEPELEALIGTTLETEAEAASDIAAHAGIADASTHGGTLTNSREPTTHNIGGSKHSSSTLAQLNAKISDATLDTSTATRPPTVHAHAPGDVTGTAVVTADTRLPPAPALADALKVVRQNAAGDAYEAGVVLGSAAQAATGDFATAAQGALAASAVQPPAAPYAVTGGRLVLSGGVLVQGFSDPADAVIHAALTYDHVPVGTSIAKAAGVYTYTVPAGTTVEFSNAGATNRLCVRKAAAGRDFAVQGRFVVDADNDNSVGLAFYRDASLLTTVHILYIQRNAGSTKIYWLNASGGVIADVDPLGQENAWLRLIVRNGNMRAYYSTAGAGSPPATWTQMGGTTAVGWDIVGLLESAPGWASYAAAWGGLPAVSSTAESLLETCL